MLKELTSRGILFICLLKERSYAFLNVKNHIELQKFHSTVHSTVYTLPMACDVLIGTFHVHI